MSRYKAFQIDELHRYNYNLVGTLLCNVPTVIWWHKNCCKLNGSRALRFYQLTSLTAPVISENYLTFKV